MELATLLPLLLLLAWLLPLASFTLIVFAGPRLGRAGHKAGYVATGAIGISLFLSLLALACWLWHHPLTPSHHAETHAAASDDPADPTHERSEHEQSAPHTGSTASPLTGDWYTLAEFGSLRLTIGYYIDALTLGMFVMVSLIATCIHVYSFGYMHEELEDVTDPLASPSSGKPLVRAGRFHRFFQYMSLFCFSMLGLVVAGNVAMVFVFWELVGICSYLLIGFYIERKSASTAANKAFIVNRVGDFGMIVGLMILFGALGTFSFGDVAQSDGTVRKGIFSQVRPAENEHQLIVPDGLIRMAAASQMNSIYASVPSNEEAEELIGRRVAELRKVGTGYWLLVLAGLGIFCGCVGKSAQFPLHVWLPDAMEGPTPVSALIHAATMVAAGVYLVGRFYPVFAPEVLLTIACVGCITLFVAATIAITATDIKRVLAYSTVSQLGYMMFSLGLGGWAAGLFHLFTHAFFKALLFLCSGSVIHACHTNEMPEMGGLRKKMPWTAWTMLVGCLAISGAGIPAMLGMKGFGLSGYYSKDSILAQAFSVASQSQTYGWLFYVAAGGAAITAFYMFRLWFMTFAGSPRNQHVYDHAHESPASMYVPLVILAFFAVVAGWKLPSLNLPDLLEQARPLGTAEGISFAGEIAHPELPAEHRSHEETLHRTVSWIAFGTALTGFAIAVLFYLLRIFNPETVRKWLAPLHAFLIHKWFFDELYEYAFVKPTLLLSQVAAAFDRLVIDRLADGSARFCVTVARLDDVIDRYVVDWAANGIGRLTYRIGLWLRQVQTGQLRQYVVMIAVSTVALFLLIVVCRNLMLFQ
ncbi:MAG: NADH-quinone oxidoreductase subunit L [Planctomycetaceae bacterium]|nr:NADH-quinone oxidoreductase subunit L [Planctomycetaceae bacterium]